MVLVSDEASRLEVRRRHHASSGLLLQNYAIRSDLGAAKILACSDQLRADLMDPKLAQEFGASFRATSLADFLGRHVSASERT
jgi:hypothetical protein